MIHARRVARLWSGGEPRLAALSDLEALGALHERLLRLDLAGELKIGRYIAMSTTPTVAADADHQIGSMRLVSAATATSTSSS